MSILTRGGDVDRKEKKRLRLWGWVGSGWSGDSFGVGKLKGQHHVSN